MIIGSPVSIEIKRSWIADNSKHYKYVHDAMGDCLADDDEEEELS